MYSYLYNIEIKRTENLETTDYMISVLIVHSTNRLYFYIEHVI